MEITIAKRFCGPPNSGNGGYSCGRLAALVGNPAEITLRAPPPLDAPLTAQRADGGVVRLMQGEQLIAEGKPATLELEIPKPPSRDEAVAAGNRFSGLKHHPYATCFVCGPSRGAHDGLRIFCGPWKDGRVAGLWTPDKTLDDGSGHVAAEFLWSAIDCPGSWSVIGRDDPDAPMGFVSPGALLGRLAGRLLRAPRIGEECTAMGWFLGNDGRKYHVGTAIHTLAGELVACSKGTWIALKG
ncbi:MAG: hypothetical protein ACT4PK_00885 [Gammaproteobacteria bacterium]